MGKLTLITGGARSGKSAHALALVAEPADARRYFIATAEALDEEMRARAARHRAERGGRFVTIEEPREPARALAALYGRADYVVLDCLTLWISNLMMSGGDDATILGAVSGLARALGHAPFRSVVVSDEVGAGIVPDNAPARRFRDLLGWTNQRVAHAADEVLLMVAGIPMRVK